MKNATLLSVLFLATLSVSTPSLCSDTGQKSLCPIITAHLYAAANAISNFLFRAEDRDPLDVSGEEDNAETLAEFVERTEPARQRGTGLNKYGLQE